MALAPNYRNLLIVACWACCFTASPSRGFGSVLAGSAGPRTDVDYVVPSTGFIQQTSNEIVTTINDTTGTIAGVQSLIDSARAANPDRFIVVTLKAGAAYAVSANPLVLGSKISLSGAGTSLVATDNITASSLVRITAGSSFVSVDRLTLDGKTKNVRGLEASGVSRVNIDRVTVRDTSLDGVFVQGQGSSTFDNEITVTRCTISGAKAGSGIRLKDATQGVVMDNACYSNSTGILIESSSDCTVVNNTGKNNVSEGIRLRDSSYTRVISNLCSGGSAGIESETSASATVSAYNSIVRNKIESAQTGILLGRSKDTVYGNEFSGVATPFVFAANTTNNRVMQSGFGSQTSNQDYFFPPTAANLHENPIKNAQDRIDVPTAATKLSAIQSVYDSARAANPGCVVVLHLTAAEIDGDEPLDLQSDTCVVLDGRVKLAAGMSAFVAAGTPANPLSFISISGGTIDGQNTTGRYGLSFTCCSKVQVQGVTMANFGTKTTRVEDSDIILFAGCTTPCVVDSCGLDGGAARGIWVKGITDSGASGMLFLDNDVSNVNMDGIDLDASTSESSVFYNMCSGNIRYGIFIEEGAKANQAVGNTCSSNDIGVNLYSYAVTPTEKNSVVANALISNGRGIRFGSRSNSLSTQSNFAFNNRISGSTSSGVDAQASGSNNYISQNVLSGNVSNYASTSSAVFFNPPSSASPGVDNANHADIEFSEGYTNGNLAGQNGWSSLNANSTSPVSLTNGLAKLAAGTNYQTAYKTISPYQFGSNSSVHLRIDVNVQTAMTNTNGADFFYATRELNRTNNQPDGKSYFRLYARASGAGFQLGWNPHAETNSVPAFATNVFNFGTDYKIVIRCDSFSSLANDNTYLFVDPTGSDSLPILSRSSWIGNSSDEFSSAANSSTSRTNGYLNLLLKQQATSLSSSNNALIVKRIIVADKLVDVGVAETGAVEAPTDFTNSSTSGRVTWTSGPGWLPSAPVGNVATTITLDSQLSGDLQITNDSPGNFLLRSLSIKNSGPGNILVSGNTLQFSPFGSMDPELTFASSTNIIQTISNTVQLDAALKITQASGSAASNAAITGMITGTGGIIKSGGGRLDLTASNSTLGGTVAVDNGYIYITRLGAAGLPSSLGTNRAISLGFAANTGNLRWGDSISTMSESSDKTLSLPGTTGGGTLDIRGTNILTLDGNIDTGANTNVRTLLLTGNGINIAARKSLVINGLISGEAKLRVNGSGDRTVVLANENNTFGGGLTIDGNISSKFYTVEVTKIGMAGFPSSLGTNGVVRVGTTNAAAYNVLRYAGTSESSDKTIDLCGTIGGALIANNGSGLLKFTSALTASGSGAKTLFIDPATADIEFSGTIPDSSGGATTLSVNQTGAVILSAANAFTGGVILKGGDLKLNHVSALPAGNSVAFTDTGVGGARLSVAYNGEGLLLGNLSLQASASIDAGTNPAASVSFASATNWSSGVILTVTNSASGKIYITDTNGVPLSRIKSAENPTYPATLAANGLLTFINPSPTPTPTPTPTPPSGSTYTGWLDAAGASHTSAALLDYAFGAASPGTLGYSYYPLVSSSSDLLILTYYVRQNAIGLTVTPELNVGLSAETFHTSNLITDASTGLVSPGGTLLDRRQSTVKKSDVGAKAFLRLKVIQR